MAEASPDTAVTVRHNPFDEPKTKRSKGVTIAIVVSIVAHAAVGVYLWKARFEQKYKAYSDEVTDVAIIAGSSWNRM